jgi:PPM family protein phosphatase
MNDTIIFRGRTDVGLVRPNNEDTFLIDDNCAYCLVADGMGGAAAGETASRLFEQSAREVFSDYAKAADQQVMDRVQAVFQIANNRILDHVVRHPAHQGMGCTAELLAFSSAGFIIGHMGDSRTYRFRQGNLKQLTKDHSLVQEHIDKGLITPEQARHHSMRNIILRAVGVRPAPALDTLRGPIFSGDIFLLCSDGLTDMVDDEDIAAVLGSGEDLQTKVDQLVESAKTAGGKDNVTVVLSEVR